MPIAAPPDRVTCPMPGRAGTAYASCEKAVTRPLGVLGSGARTAPNIVRSMSAWASYPGQSLM
jgi:hypothetical protein